MLLTAVGMVAQAWAIVCALRLLTQWGGLPFSHPLAQFCVHITQWLVLPLRTILPPVKRWDVGTLAAGLVLPWLLWLIGLNLHGFIGHRSWSAEAAVWAIVLAGLDGLSGLAYALLGLLFVRMVLGLQRPFAPLVPVINRIVQPLCRPFAFLRIGRWDFSGSLLALVLWVWISVCAPTLVRTVLLRFFTGLGAF